MYDGEECNDEFVEAFLACGLWTHNELDGFKIHDIHEGDIDWILNECNDFQFKAEQIIRQYAPSLVVDETQLGHDFLLTRNGHGAGFWDGDWPDPLGNHLTTLSKRFCEIYFYKGDDGKIYIDKC